MSRILDNLFLGSYSDAKNTELLYNLKITHIVTIGAELKVQFPRSFKYLYIAAKDNSDYDISSHFEEITEFIHDAIGRGHGRVLVHCYWGISRSAAAVLAYLMKYEKMTLSEANLFVKQIRNMVYPNEGFMKQLTMYEQNLRALKEKISNERTTSSTPVVKKLNISRNGYEPIESNRSSYRAHGHYRSSSTSSISSLDISNLKKKDKSKTPFMDYRTALLSIDPVRKNENILNKLNNSSSFLKTMDYFCRECGTGLFSKTDILHNAIKESKGNCSAIYIKYKPWFGNINIDWRGILCPNKGCATSLGFINQKGGECPCGKHFNSMYFVNNSKITSN